MKSLFSFIISLFLMSATLLAVPVTAPGINNFGQVTPHLYRGAQPTAAGFAYLHKIGVTIDVDLRSPYPQAEHEKALANLNGIRFVHLYWRAEPWLFGPNTEDISDFLRIISENPNAKIFVHCRRGSDRTGTVVAAYRIKVQGWNNQKAINEMHEYHVHWYLFPLWVRWVKHLK